jgi:hypothetical protein
LSSDAPESTRAPLDETLIAIIGILDEIRKAEDVATWIGDGHLKMIERKVSKLGEMASLTSSSALASLNAVSQNDALWFEDQQILAYWINKGRKVLEDLNIPILPGSTERIADNPVPVTLIEAQT